MRHEIEVESDFHQFYLWDVGTDPLEPDDYDQTDMDNRVKLDSHIMVIQPIRNGRVPVVIEVHDTDPGCDRSSWDHVVECSVEFPTGRLQVHECAGEAVLEFEVSPGSYQARVLFSGLETLSYDELEGDDRYAIELWPGPKRTLKISKRWIEPTEG